MGTGTQSKAVTPQKLGEAGGGYGSLSGQGHWWWRVQEILTSISSPGTNILAETGPTQQLAGSSAGIS